MMQKREVTTEEAAEILGVGRITIQEGMKCGALEIGAAFKQTGYVPPFLPASNANFKQGNLQTQPCPCLSS